MAVERAELEVVADRGGGGGDLAERLAVAVERAELLDVGRVAQELEVVAELAALDVGHVAQEHDTRRSIPGSSERLAVVRCSPSCTR
jgi:hypothetical protein